MTQKTWFSHITVKFTKKFSNKECKFTKISALLLFLDVRTFEGTITIVRDFENELLIRNSLAWLQLSLSIENAVGIVMDGFH